MHLLRQLKAAAYRAGLAESVLGRRAQPLEDAL
jgi:hypothetical protein